MDEFQNCFLLIVAGSFASIFVNKFTYPRNKVTIIIVKINSLRSRFTGSYIKRREAWYTSISIYVWNGEGWWKPTCKLPVRKWRKRNIEMCYKTNSQNKMTKYQGRLNNQTAFSQIGHYSLNISSRAISRNRTCETVFRNTVFKCSFCHSSIWHSERVQDYQSVVTSSILV